MADDKKIIIDDDWKSQAAREKEQLAEAVESAAAAKGQGVGPVPEGGLAGLVQLLAMQALVGLGGFVGPGGQEIPPNLDLAKLHIDMLDVLEQKTKGNLDPQEKAMLDTTLHQLRMAYVEAMQMSAGPRHADQPNRTQ